MFKTKKDVDAHVRTALSKVRSETERHLRGFTVGKLYFKINEYSSAEQYLISYLSVKQDNDQAHKLLGQCYQRLKKPDKALQAFSSSLHLNPKQPDVLAEVCQLMLEDKHFDSSKAKYWCELAESEKVQHELVFSLRLKLMNEDHLGTNKVEEIIQKEIAARPNDVQLRVRLIRNYVEKNQILDAFKYVHQLEMSQKDEFVTSAEWYNIVWLVLSKYEKIPNFKKDWDFWLLVATCLERQVQISFTSTVSSTIGGGAVTETANLLFNFDQYLYKISQLCDKFCVQKELVQIFLGHYRGQLLLHAAALIFKRELLQNKNKWKETTRIALPLLLLAYQINARGNKEPWMKHCDEQSTQLLALWHREGSFRCAQVGRTLLSCINEDTSVDKENAHNINYLMGSQLTTLWQNNDELLAQVREICSDRQWRYNIFSLLFCNGDQKVKEQTSLFAKCSKLSEPLYEMPSYADVERYEDDAQYLRPQSLQHMVYLCLGNDNLSYIKAKYFNGLNFSTHNLSFCGAESLNQLDMDSFLYAATIQAKRAVAVERESFESYQSGNSAAAGKPKILPFINLQNMLCSEEQSQWWYSAYMVYKNLSDSHNLAELRANLQYGIEAVRGINGPKVDMAIVFKLGQLFVARAQDIVKPLEKTFLEDRAETIYKYGLNMMKMHNKGVLEPFRKYFKYCKSHTSAAERELVAAAEDAVSYLASRYFKKSEYEDLIEELSGVHLPFATYLQAEAYRKLDESSKTPKKTKQMYLERASECLNQTLSLLKSSAHADPNHPLNSVVHNEIKRLQQASARYLNESTVNCSPKAGHSNSSTYEDAEEDFYAEKSNVSAGLLLNTVRHRRETSSSANALISNNNQEMENLIKQVSQTLKVELGNVTKEICTLKEKISNLEDAVKKMRISSNPPSRDDASHMLDDLYLIEDSLQQQMYQQQQQPSAAPHINPQQYGSHACSMANVTNMLPNSPFLTQQQRLQAFNSSMFPPAHGFPMNFYGHPNQPNPYLIAPPPLPPPINQRAGPLTSLPYLDPTAPLPPTGLNFNMTATATPLLPVPNQVHPPQPLPVDPNKPSNLYNLLQQINPSHGNPIPPIAVPTSISHTSVPMSVPLSNTVPINSIPSTNMQNNKPFNNQPVDKMPPANVVITNSDPLPNPNTVAMQALQHPPLSVTIPSHHIKPSVFNQPPPTIEAAPVTNKTASSTSNNSFVSNAFGTSIATSTFSFKLQVAAAAAKGNNNPLGSTPSTPNDTLCKTSESLNSDINRSGTEEVEYDPRPDFQPIISLPDEIEVRTGEEDEEIMFCHRAKLFRHIDKEWKERGIGDIKILKNKEGTSRILMRRDQTHKICANHTITPELVLTVPKNETKGFIWAANDFADESLHLEKFFVRFKLPETAKQFEDAFKNAQNYSKDKQNTLTKVDEDKCKIVSSTSSKSTVPFSLAKSSVTNFFTSTPAAKGEAAVGDGLKPVFGQSVTLASTSTTSVTDVTTVSKSLFSGFSLPTKSSEGDDKVNKTTTAASPFANFTFSKSIAPSKISTTLTSTTSIPVSSSNTASPFASIFSNLSSSPFSTTSSTAIAVTPATVNETTGSNAANKSSASDNEDEFVPTAQFNPVIALPDLVEVSTGEENELILFEHRAKLLRFDKDASEWKERGLGNIKLLQDKDDINKVRLVMRREQIHKLCCNQRVYKDTVFKYAKNSKVALSWAGQDFSENELNTEMLTVRFKLPETCKKFLDAITEAQAKMKSDGEELNSKANEKKTVTLADKSTKGFGDAFKPKGGSWSCDACYISNDVDQLYCVACDTPKDSTVPKKETNSNVLATKNTTKFNFGFSTSTVQTTTEQSPAAISKSIFGIKPASVTSTTASDSVKTNEPASTTVVQKPIFDFGSCTINGTSKPNEINATTKPAAPSGFGDAFKPKAGSWSCNGCYVSNTADTVYCKACEAPKDDTVPKKVSNTNVLTLSNPGQNFNFGFSTATTAVTKTQSMGDANKQIAPTFSFGESQATSFIFSQTPATSTTLNSKLSSGTTISTSNAGIGESTFTFTLAPKESAATSGSGLESTSNIFNIKPKSSGKAIKSPTKIDGGDNDADGEEDAEADGHEEDEENNTYFTPVIPLPDKIEVKTGEEYEELLYEHRAKLYRFTGDEWKERGFGNVKILRHKEDKKLRVIMRRDQIFKICLNHVLNDDVDYKRKDEKSWLFAVHDFSEGTVELEKFSLRFKTKEIAEEFMDSVKKALNGTAKVISSPVNMSKTTSTKTEPSVSDLGISEEDKVTADKLKLPYEFFTGKTTCGGCRGCDSDKFEFVYVNDISKPMVNKEDTENPLVVMELPDLTINKATLNRSILKQSVLSPDNHEEETTRINNNTSSDIGGDKSTAFASTATSANKSKSSNFSFTAALNNSTKSVEETKPFGSVATGGFFFGSADTIRSTNTSGSIFGGFQNNKSILGGNHVSFGEVAATDNSIKSDETTDSSDKTTIKSIFSGNTTSGSIFGQKSVFGTAAPAPTFGTSYAINANKPIFEKSANSENVANSSIFGSTTNAPVFGTKVPIFGSISQNMTKFGSVTKDGNTTSSGSAGFTFSDLSKPAAIAPNASTLQTGDESSIYDLSNTQTASFDFATLAKASSNITALGGTASEKPVGGFIGLTHQNAFSSFDKPSAANESQKSVGGSEDDGAQNDANYDPHYEPIIALPDEIVVTTGEEEEKKLFGETATLFRWDGTSKEWKERGFGELKILSHPVKKTYRLLMRRAKIHKLVLNQAVNGDFHFTNMSNNPKSFVWASLNFAESKAGELEKLAVRFKNVDDAEAFKTKLNECIMDSLKLSGD